MTIITKRALTAGVIMLFVGFGMNIIFEALFPQLAREYQNSSLFRPWTDPLMMVFFFYPFILAFSLSYLWEKVHTHFESISMLNTIRNFTLFYFLIASVPGMFISYTTFPISFMMILSWTVSGLLNVMIATYVFIKIKKYYDTKT